MDSNPFLMTVDVPTESRGGVLCVRMSGDVDLADNWALALVAPRVRATGAHTIFLDVGPVTFFGSTMVNFIVHLLDPGSGSRIVVCQPSPTARRVVAALTLPEEISMRLDLPPEWVEPPTTRSPSTVPASPPDLAGGSVIRRRAVHRPASVRNGLRSIPAAADTISRAGDDDVGGREDQGARAGEP